ncbi:hypothetical protein ACQP1V_43240 (plasmid) [Microtetraspora malaysiensis]|uniref:hypothetical protein n=1 Tax=Microtetraspora malaysiensis TaxID=161358 RepID=UPI003D8C9447
MDLYAQARTAADHARRLMRVHAAHTHTCATCAFRRPCELSLALLDDATDAGRRAADALHAYAPPGTFAYYQGPKINRHGGWTVAGLCRCCNRAAYLLARPTGLQLTCVTPDQFALTAAGIEPEGIMSDVRTAARELSRVLAMLDVPLIINVDEDRDGAPRVAYASREFDRAMTAVAAMGHRLHASYATAALTALESLRTYARHGATNGILHIAHAARRIIAQLEKPTTRRPSSR